MITLFVPDIKSDIADKHTNIITAELFKNKIFIATAKAVNRKNNPHNATKSFMYLLKNTATAVPNTAIKGKNKVNRILKYINVEFWQTLTHRKVSRQFQPIYSQFKNVNLHSTRHTYASLAHFVGIDDKIIQNQLGHKTLAMTQDTYTNIMIPGESIILSYFEKLKEIIRFTR